MKNLDHFNKPSIAVINGPAFGGALGLIACCDIALATDNAVFCFSEVKLGLIPAVISPYILRAIGQRQARRYFLTAEKFDAKQALNMGFIHDIIQTSELVTAPQKLIHQCLNNGPQALIAAKELIRKVAYHAIDEDLFRETAMLIAKIRVSDEAQAGLAAFFAKQTPDWIKDEKN